jgi:hypothetical protein
MDTPSQTLRAELFADYFQFYVWDKGALPDAPTDWTEEDVVNRLKAAPNVVVVCPVRNMTVPVELEVLASEPELRSDPWDHIAECSLELPSGQLELHECTGGSAGVLSVVPGSYRVRAYFGGLDSLSEDGLSGDDHYRVTLWPAPRAPLRVVKQWCSANGA